MFDRIFCKVITQNNYFYLKSNWNCFQFFFAAVLDFIILVDTAFLALDLFCMLFDEESVIFS